MEITPVKIFFAWSFILGLELVIAGVMLRPDDFAVQVERERALVTAWVGHETEARLRRRGEAWYQLLFVRTGLNELFLPDNAAANSPAGMEQFVATIVQKMESVGVLVRQATYRLSVITQLIVCALGVLVAIIVDGDVRRRILRDQGQPARPRFYHIAKRTMLAVMVLPLAVAICPIAVNPAFILAWLAVVAALIWVWSTHVEAVL